MGLAGIGVSSYVFSIAIFLLTQVLILVPFEAGNYALPALSLGFAFGGMFVLVISYFLFRAAFSLLNGQMTLREFNTNGAIESFLNELRFRSAVECLRFFIVAFKTLTSEIDCYIRVFH